MNTDKYISNVVKSIPPSGIRKFFDLVTNSKDIISLGVGEPDFVTPWEIRKEGINALDRGSTTYTSNLGLPELRMAISYFLKTHYNLTYDPEKEIMVTIGASEAIDLALRALLNDGDEVLVPEPSYVSYAPCVTLTRGIPVFVPTDEKNNFILTPDDLKSKITSKTKALILPYPNNPTGAIMKKEELEEIVNIIIEHDLIVISDEIYSELTYEGRHVSIASLPGMKERTILINGFSKAFAMTGWRLGYIAAEHGFIEAMNKIHQYTTICAPITAQYAAIKGIYQCEEDIVKMRETYDKRRKFIVNGFREIGFDCFEPKGAFYIFPSIKKTGMTSQEFCEKLLKEEKVAVVPGDAFGPSGEGFIRVSYAYSLDKIARALERIENFVKRIL
ncbi:MULTISPECIES: aminotransferase class I/II-fold pyridoxal phosphate-dependent enzyme [Thermoanaerobacter]|uniref:Aminotransferase n=2 Tax=Thermoanaerobacter TaxID=1754 RepID=B0KDD4_THEP3|nr:MULTISPECIES: aminotransferase class I/II-fold pyridoxal phosphate-dependent enzyme [Thermoanaerobacter]ABY95653.1 aminotransferase, class I and II [Thermoanaerobacter pseudethanolicus ATCC 33223]ADV80591.1 aminotransferase class I and II [Thermoanaerobacter brockii subsp. finnii Ako-1]HBW59771.1 aminotransferase class V-fold PLP-dependent enzyme [Thermoanaerobacter sp.]